MDIIAARRLVSQSISDSAHIISVAPHHCAVTGGGAEKEITPQKPMAQLAESAAESPTEARLLSSFVPALMLRTIETDKAPIEPPATRNYEAVSLFAVGTFCSHSHAHESCSCDCV